MNKTTQSRQQGQRSIVFDVSSVPFGRGVSRYSTNIVRELVSQSQTEVTLWGYSWSQYQALRQWGALFGSHTQKRFYKLPPRIMELAMQTLPSSAWPLVWNAPAHSVLHAWEWQLPRNWNGPTVVTIHDLAYKLFNEVAYPPVVAHVDATLRWIEATPHAQIIAVSQATRNDIVNLTNIEPERIHVVSEALPQEAEYRPDAKTCTATQERLGLPERFLLFVGTPEPRKNVQRIVQAWQKLRQEDSELALVIVGGESWTEVEPQPGLHRLGYLSGEELACLYQQAQLFVFPSLYEGFGLPILEAFFHGCPVVTSKVSSLPEVAGEAAELVDPYSVDAIYQACFKILKENETQRKKRRTNMQTQLEQFSWSKAAQETVQVYDAAQQAFAQLKETNGR